MDVTGQDVHPGGKNRILEEIFFFQTPAAFSHFSTLFGISEFHYFGFSKQPISRLHYLTSLHSAFSRAFSDLCLGEASIKINLEQVLRNGIQYLFALSERSTLECQLGIQWNPSQSSILAGTSASSLRDRRQKWINEQINEITLSPAGPGLNLEAGCWVIDWRVWCPTTQQ